MNKESSYILSFLPLIAPLIVITTFTIDRIIAFKVRKKESKRSWYLKAYFDNSIKKVDEFFENSEKLMEDFLNEYMVLSKKSSSKRNELKKLEFLANVNSTFTDLKRKFEINVLAIFHKQYPEIKHKVENSLLDYEDACTILSNNNIDIENKFYEFIEILYNIKSNLIIALSEPVLDKKEHINWKEVSRFFPWLIFFKF